MLSSRWSGAAQVGLEMDHRVLSPAARSIGRGVEAGEWDERGGGAGRFERRVGDLEQIDGSGDIVEAPKWISERIYHAQAACSCAQDVKALCLELEASS